MFNMLNVSGSLCLWLIYYCNDNTMGVENEKNDFYTVSFGLHDVLKKSLSR